MKPSYQYFLDTVGDIEPDSDNMMSDEQITDLIQTLLGNLGYDYPFLSDLWDCAGYKHENGEIPGVIDFKTATCNDLVAFLVKAERAYKRVSQLTDILESNRGQARELLGQIMKDHNEGRIEFNDPETGTKLANILLESKNRPTFTDSDTMLKFIRDMGQAGVIKEDVQWQTRDKVVDDTIDNLPSAPYDSQTQLPDPGLLVEGYFTYQPTARTTILAYKFADSSWKKVATLFQTNIAKVSKLYA